MHPTGSDRQQLVQLAIDILKEQDEQLFAAAQLELMAGIDRLNAIGAALPKVPGTERMEYALRGLSKRASAYLRLVKNLKTQEAYATVVNVMFTDIAHEDYMGVVGLQPLPGHPDFLRIELRARYWIKESYKRIAKAATDRGAKTASSKPNRQVREPNPNVLKGKNTINGKQAAEALGITERTLNRWIADTTLTPIRIGGRNRFDTKDLLRILNNKKQDKD
jgi:excisionase family DNA binding protein